MSIIVQKYGGASIETIEKMHYIADRIINKVNRIINKVSQGTSVVAGAPAKIVKEKDEKTASKVRILDDLRK